MQKSSFNVDYFAYLRERLTDNKEEKPNKKNESCVKKRKRKRKKDYFGILTKLKTFGTGVN